MAVRLISDVRERWEAASVAGVPSAVIRRFAGGRPAAGLVTAINLLLIAFSANYTADLLWMLAGPSAGQSNAGEIAWGAPTGRQSADFGVLSAYDPFHRTAAKAAEMAVQSAPETSLDLKLFGVRAGRDAKGGTAIIRTPDKQQGVFRTGDEIMNAVRLRAVLPDRVVISHRGVTESLLLDPDAAERRAIVMALQVAPEAEEPAPAGIRDMESLMQAVSVTPRRIEGGFDGFVLSPGTNGDAFRAAGLQAGDVLLAVNDTPLDDPARMAELRAELGNAQAIRLAIERDGERKTIEISTQD